GKRKAKRAPFGGGTGAPGVVTGVWLGGGCGLEGQPTGGAVVVFLLSLGKMYKPMRDLSKMTDTVSKAMIGAERIKELIHTEDRVRDRPHSRTAPRFR